MSSQEQRSEDPGATPAQGALQAMVLVSPTEEVLFPARAFAEIGCTVVYAHTLDEARAACSTALAVVVMPLTFDGKPLTDLLATCKGLPNMAVVVIAENDQINEAAAAMRYGADDCLFRPFSPTRLIRTVRTVLPPGRVPVDRPIPDSGAPTNADAPQLTPSAPSAHSPHTLQSPTSSDLHAAPSPSAPTSGAELQPLTEVTPLAEPEPGAPLTFHGMIGGCSVMQETFRRATVIAPTNATVMIRGEVGTGKSALARALHAESSRADAPFVAVDCGSLVGDRFDTVFFSTAPDALGALRRASGGTLFLDRVDELDPAAQSRLLAALDSAAVGRPGSPDLDKIDLRVISTLSPRAEARLADGSFREDLFFVLNVVQIVLPPLRLRDGDVMEIFTQRLETLAAQNAVAPPHLTPSAITRLKGHDWPGNLRELDNLVRELVLTRSDSVVDGPDLPLSRAVRPVIDPLSRRAATNAPMGGEAHTASGTGLGSFVGMRLADIEKVVIEATIAAEGGSIPRAARILDVSPSTIYRKRETWSHD